MHEEGKTALLRDFVGQKIGFEMEILVLRRFFKTFHI
jgi:hypothetical protein